MTAVTIRGYVSASGRNAFEDWYENQEPEVRANFLDTVTALRDQPRSGWKRPYYSPLKRDGFGLGEIRFKVLNIQYRPIGFFTGKEIFTIVLFAIEKDNKFDPETAVKISQKRKKEINDNPERACDLDI